VEIVGFYMAVPRSSHTHYGVRFGYTVINPDDIWRGSMLI